MTMQPLWRWVSQHSWVLLSQTSIWCVWLHRGLSTSAHHCSNSRFGVAGWFGDGVGLLFCLQYFPWFPATGKVFNLIYSFGISNLICGSGKDHCSILSVLHQYQYTRSCNIPNNFNTLHILCLGDDTMVHAAHHYRILTVAGVKRRADGRLNIYQHFIGVFVESSALYSYLIVFLALTVREDFGLYYLDAIAGIAKVRRWN